MREEPDPMRLIIQLGAIVALLATVALSIGSLRDVSVASERSLIATEQAHLDGRELARCPSSTSEQRPFDEACRRVWADNRRRFLGLDQEVGKAATTNTPTTLSQQSPYNNRVYSNRPTGSTAEKE
jgi:conjugative transfer region protein TrbK